MYKKRIDRVNVRSTSTTKEILSVLSKKLGVSQADIVELAVYLLDDLVYMIPAFKTHELLDLNQAVGSTIQDDFIKKLTRLKEK